MSSPRLVILDNEAVQALTDVSHAKHRRALALVEATAGSNRTRGRTQRLVVPTAVRVAAGWNRSTPGAAVINRLRVIDSVLDAETADTAASIRTALEVSVADAHLGATLTADDGPVTVLTSDTEDAGRIAEHLGIDATIVRL